MRCAVGLTSRYTPSLLLFAETVQLLVDDVVDDGAPVAVLEQVINRIEIQIEGRRQLDIAHVAFCLPHAQAVLPNPHVVRVALLDDDLVAVDHEDRIADFNLFELFLHLAHDASIIKEDRRERLSSTKKSKADSF